MHNDSNKALLKLDMPVGVRTFAEYQTIALRQAATQLNCQPSDIMLEYPCQLLASAELAVTARPAGTVVVSQIKRLADWRKLCVAGAVLITMMAMMVLWQWQRIAGQQRLAQVELAQIVSQLEGFKKTIQTPTGQTEISSPMDKAKRMVSQDMNPIFLTIENMRVPNVRLKQLTFDATSQSVQVTYDMRDAAQVVQITAALATSDGMLKWTLKNITDRQAQWAGSF